MSEEKLAVNWYDRNAVSIANHYSVIKAPHAATTRLTYTCPKDKMAFIEILELKVTRTTAPDAKALVSDYWLYVDLKRDLTKRILEVAISEEQQDSAVASLMLFPGDTLESYSWDQSTGGEVYHLHSYKGATFDPYPIEFPLFPHELPKPDIQEPEKPWWWPF